MTSIKIILLLIFIFNEINFYGQRGKDFCLVPLTGGFPPSTSYRHQYTALQLFSLSSLESKPKPSTITEIKRITGKDTMSLIINDTTKIILKTWIKIETDSAELRRLQELLKPVVGSGPFPIDLYRDLPIGAKEASKAYEIKIKRQDANYIRLQIYAKANLMSGPEEDEVEDRLGIELYHEIDGLDVASPHRYFYEQIIYNAAELSKAVMFLDEKGLKKLGEDYTIVYYNKDGRKKRIIQN